MTLPNFLVIGAQKAGTTSVHQYLRRHHQVYTPEQKEAHFFSYEGQPLGHRGPAAPPSIVVTELSDYEKLFDAVRGETAIGEVSPSYLYVEQAPRRIAHHVPDARLIAILRDPVERAFSNWLHCLRSGREPIGDFATALAAEPDRIAQGWSALWHYRQKGLYHQCLSRYLALFPKEQMLILLHEDLTRDTAGALRRIWRFLGVDENVQVDVTQRFNVTGVPRNAMLGAAMSRLRPMIPLARRLLPRSTRQLIQRRLLHKPQLDPRVREKLLDDYRDDIGRLQDLLQRDLSHWLTPKHGELNHREH